MGMSIDNCGNIYPNPIADEMNKIVEEVTETHEKFIFATIKPFCESVVEMEISKDDLTHALLLWKNYDKRLKADMVAMLTEIQLEIEECVDGAEGSPEFEQGVSNARVQVVEMIQQKIDKLKEQTDGTDNN